MRYFHHLFLLILLITVLAACNKSEEASKEAVESYKNPITLDDEWEQYGLGDPYILKFNGMYYLYVSTRDTDIGVKVWSSENLVDWQYEGLSTEDPVTKAAYAPEVIYWNGYFYMYTSPGGSGHYILKSDSPTGPFNVVTENIGRTIDGNVFIDDDGSMYFSYAGSSGIQIAPMEDPMTIGQGVTSDAFMNGWTEGSTIFKRHGNYYMTYTGNHVFSNAYRVDYAVSDNPMNGYKPSDNNPIIINTEGSHVGLGHNSIIKGPNLDTDYMIYHNLEGPGVVGPLRHMNMDRIAWNGEKMTVLGPTYTEQQAPTLATFDDRFGRNKLGSDWESVSGDWKIEDQSYLTQRSLSKEEYAMLVTNEQSETNYTAEFHAKMAESDITSTSLFGAVFSYQDQDNYGTALFNPNNNSLDIQFVINGERSNWNSINLPAEFDYTKLHQIRVEKYTNTFRIYVDGMLKHTANADLNSGSIGYSTKGMRADFGYTAFSNAVNGSGVWDVYKPIPGDIQAVHYQAGNDGYQANQTETNSSYRVDPIIKQELSDGSYGVQLNSGDWLNYKVNVAQSETYHVDIRVATDADNGTLRLLQNNEDVTGSVSIPNTNGKWTTITVENLDLTGGETELKLELVDGKVSLASFDFYQGDPVEYQQDDFTEGLQSEWTMYESYWSVNDGIFTASEGTFSKALTGKTGWTDYTVHADVQLKKDDGNAGIIVRALHPANGMERNQNNPDFNQGYYANIQADGVYLVKQNFGREVIEHVSMDLPVDTWHQMKVTASGTKIEVFINDEEEPVIKYEDDSAQPFTHGKLGLMTVNNRAEFDNVHVFSE